ncbi:MAG TPA: hypothetical protein VES39_07080 [Rhodospirillales bacterium]|nr:hypothetical protein [Rhodospirillales bacterium]
MQQQQTGHIARRLAIIASVLVLAACSGPRTSPTYRNPDSRGFAQDAMARGPLPVVVQGVPFAQAEARTQQVVLESMRQAMSWTATPRLIADPSLKATAPLYVVMTFNSGAMDANVQCTLPPGGGGPQEQGAVQVAASFCGGGSLISNTSGRIDRAAGPDDPAFGQLIAQVTSDLFPSTFQPRPGVGFGVGIGSGGWSGGGAGVGVGF